MQSSLPRNEHSSSSRDMDDILRVLTAMEDILSFWPTLIVYVKKKICFLLFCESFVIQQVLSQNNSRLPLGAESIK